MTIRMVFRLMLLLLLGVGLAWSTHRVIGADDPAEKPTGDQNAATWPQWRGPSRDGRIAKAQWPAQLSNKSLQRKWRVELGPSYSGPIIADDVVFTTETKDRKEELVKALDRNTGEEKWSASWKGAMTVPFFAAANGSWIRSTPAYENNALYVGGILDQLVRLDATSGKIDWTDDFKKLYDTPKPMFGMVCSPLITDDALYVQAALGVCRVEKKSGKVKWRSFASPAGMSSNGAFSSPILTTLAGKKQLVVQARLELAGLDPETGKVLWKQAVPNFRGMNILTPTVVGDDQLFTSSYKQGSYLYKITKSDKGTFQCTEVWKNRLAGYMSSPVVIDNYIYLHLGNNRLCCLDAKTGKEQWRSKPYGKYWSMIANGKKILALDQAGMLYLIKANPEKMELLGSAKVSDQETWAHLAISGNEIFIRELNAMSKFVWTAEQETQEK